MVKYVKDFEFPNSGKTHVKGYMRGGSCGYAEGGKVSTGKTPGKGPEHTLGFAKGGHAKPKMAPKGLSVMIAVSDKKAPSASKKGASPVPGVALGMKKGGMAKVEKVMGEYGKGELHSGSKKGPIVENPKQAVAIALSEARKAGAKVPMKKAEGGPAIKPAMKGPTRAEFDAMMAKRAAEQARRVNPKLMTPAERAMLGRETMIGRKKGGSVKC